MLLQNDYYLETRGHIFSNEILGLNSNVDYVKNLLETHISNDTVHNYDNSTIKYTTYNITKEYKTEVQIKEDDDVLRENKVIFLPITKSAGDLNQIISNVPKNLNGNTLVFLFTVPSDYESISGKFILNVKHDSINFENFSNGTLIILGDYLHKTKIQCKEHENCKIHETENFTFSYKNSEIEVGVDQFIEKLLYEIKNPEPIDNIISYETENIESLSINLNKIKIIRKLFKFSIFFNMFK